MRQSHLRHAFGFALLLPTLFSPVSSLAQEASLPMGSDWMEFVTGHRDQRTGTEVRRIDTEGEAGYHTITLAVPKKSVGNPDAIEEVVVIGRKPEKPEPLLDIQYEWVDDYDEDNYGLVIRLSEDTQWPIRIYMRSDEGFINR